MATLYDYLAGMTVGGYSLLWSDQPLKKSQVDASSGRPYVRVEVLGERAADNLYGNIEVIEATVDCLIYQAPTSTGVAPNKDAAMELYFGLQDAVRGVDAWVYGQPLIAIHRDVRIPPDYDDRSGGLSGMVRFRLLFPRG